MRFLAGALIGAFAALASMGHPELRALISDRVGGAGLAIIQPSVGPRSVGPRSVEPSMSELPAPTSEPAPQKLSPIDPPSVTAPEPEPQVLAEGGFQVAWVPFRSEISARGFAASLEANVAHAFDVKKTGPGRYEVGFAFADAGERADVLSRVEALTGYLPGERGAL